MVDPLGTGVLHNALQRRAVFRDQLHLVQEEGGLCTQPLASLLWAEPEHIHGAVDPRRMSLGAQAL